MRRATTVLFVLLPCLGGLGVAQFEAIVESVVETTGSFVIHCPEEALGPINTLLPGQAVERKMVCAFLQGAMEFQYRLENVDSGLAEVMSPDAVKEGWFHSGRDSLLAIGNKTDRSVTMILMLTLEDRTALLVFAHLANPDTSFAPTGDPLALYDDSGNGRISCAEARAHGIAPVHSDHPAYRYMTDRNQDGVVCE